MFNNAHQSGQGTLKMSPGSCPLVKVSGEMFTTLDNQGQQVVRDFDTLVHTQIHIHTDPRTPSALSLPTPPHIQTHTHTQTERR